MFDTYDNFIEYNNRRVITIISVDYNTQCMVVSQGKKKFNLTIQEFISKKSYCYVTNPNMLDAKWYVKGYFEYNSEKKLTIKKVDKNYVYVDIPYVDRYPVEGYSNGRILIPDFLIYYIHDDDYPYISNPSVLKSFFDRYTDKTTKIINKKKMFFDMLQEKYNITSFFDDGQLYKMRTMAKDYFSTIKLKKK